MAPSSRETQTKEGYTMKAKEIDYHYNVDGLGYEAFIYALPESNRYAVVFKYEGKQFQKAHTNSYAHALEIAERWTH